MKIESVKMMRDIREQISFDIKEMTFAEEQEYLMKQIRTFQYLTLNEAKSEISLQQSVDCMWAKEADVRVESYEHGDIETVPAKDVFAKYRQT